MPIKVHVFLTAKNKTKTCQIKIEWTILIEWTNFFQIKSSNVKFSKYENQPLGGVCKKGVLKSFEKFIGKYPWCSLYFNKISGWESATILKRSLRYMCFPKNVAIFKNICFVEHQGTAVSKISSKNEYPINSRIR